MAGIDACFVRGVRLFNQGNFFEAHELWEDKWKKAEGEEKIFYQGIIHEIAFSEFIDNSPD